jgi:hypothetical protein
MTTYRLEVWNKQSKRYETTWKGKDFVRAQIMAAKPYNNRDWQGKKRIISITTRIELELLHVRNI